MNGFGQAFGQYGGPAGNANGFEEITTLWVGDLPAACSNEDLLGGFVDYRVSNATVSSRPSASGARSGFVRFLHRHEAESALNAACGGMIGVSGQSVSCQWAKQNSYGGAQAGLNGGNGGVGQSFSAHVVAPPGTGYGGCKGYGGKGYSAMPYNPPPWHMGGATSPWGHEEIATLWLGNLAEGTTVEEMTSVFSSYGNVLIASVSNKLSPQGSLSGFVRFSARHEAEAALTQVIGDNILIQGAPIVARWARVNSKLEGDTAVVGSSPVVGVSAGSSSTLFLGSIPLDATENDVTDALFNAGIASQGDVVCKMQRPNVHGLSCFVKFASPEAAQQALNLNLARPLTIHGQVLKVTFAKQDTR